jgi:hypothetical protein
MPPLVVQLMAVSVFFIRRALLADKAVRGVRALGDTQGGRDNQPVIRVW